MEPGRERIRTAQSCRGTHRLLQQHEVIELGSTGSTGLSSGEVFVHTSTRLLLGCAVVLIHALTPVAYATRRTLALEDFYAIKSVEDASTSADGRWAVYTIQEIDREKNARISSIWRVPVAGGAAEEMVRGRDNDRLPRFSPDGRYLAFVSDRNADAWGISGSVSSRGQVFLLPLSGGAPFPAT